MSVLLLTGESGAGKSTVGHNVAAARNGLHIAEREVSRAIAAEKGYQRSRHWVCDVGLSEAATAIRQRTVEMVGAQPKDRLTIIDGVYDAKFPEALRLAIPRIKLGIVAVEASLGLRAKRCAQRMGGIALQKALAEVAYLDAIKHEVGMDELIAAADLVVVNEGYLEAAETQIHDWLDRRG